MVAANAKLPVTELIASLSLATDLGTGQPLGHGLSTSMLSVAIARAMGLDHERVRSAQQVALLRFIGCTADIDELSAVAGGNDLAFDAAMAPALMGGAMEQMRVFLAAVGGSKTFPQRARILVGALADPDGGNRTLRAHCEVGARLARRLGLSDPVVTAISHAYERWDGKGMPSGLEGEEIPVEVRIATVARDADLFARQGEDAATKLRQRSGKAYDPALVEAVIPLMQAHAEAEWDEVLAAEPEPPATLDDLDAALTVIADFADLKSPWTRGHSPRVAELAKAAGQIIGLDLDGYRMLERAALVHDLGRVGVDNGVWDKPGALATSEWEQVRLHPYLTQRVLSRCETLKPLGELASSHHERLDGSGYHRNLTGDQLSQSAKLLAAADALAALTADRPHRPALGLRDAVSALESEVSDGRLDHAAVSAVVEAAGMPGLEGRRQNPGGLTDREVEVLRLLARGHSNKQVGAELFISPKTVGRHVENIYGKIDVSTRAGATMYAMEQRLVG